MTEIQKPKWIELRMPNGKLVAKFDPSRLLLQVRFKGELETFDLAEIIDASK